MIIDEGIVSVQVGFILTKWYVNLPKPSLSHLVFLWFYIN